MTLAQDANPQVRREVALALRFIDNESANLIWGHLAAKHKPGDRWSVEALGIGADLHWDTRLAATINPKPDLVWRSRASDSAERITKLLLASNGDDSAKYFRALQFQKDKEATQSAYADVFQKGRQESALLAASQLGPDAIAALPGGKTRLDSLIAPVRGKPEFVQLAERLQLRGFSSELIDFIISNPDSTDSVTAARLLLDDRRPIHQILHGSDQAAASALATALGKTGDRKATGLLANELKSDQTPAAARRAIVNALVISSQGSRDLIGLAKQNQLADELKPIAALGLARSPDQRVRREAAQLLPVPDAEGASDLPPISELAEISGSAAKGAAAYSKAACITCHQVNGQHIAFGPDLSGIGNKLSKEAMFEAILFPSAAISHGFHGVTLKLKEGGSLAGYLTSETDTTLTIHLPGGVRQKISNDTIASRQDMEQSLMPPGLAAALSQQELADLVAYLMTLKK